MLGTRRGAGPETQRRLLQFVWTAGLALLENWVPVGYEDEFGFHYGTPQGGFARNN